MVLKFDSSKSGLTYYMLQPMVVVNSRSQYSVLVLVVFFLIAIVVGILLSIYMSMKNATPINDILKEVSKTSEQIEGQQTTFTNLKATFNQLINTNSNMARVIEKQKPFLRNAFFNRLIYGNFTTEEEAGMIADNIGLLQKNRVFGIVVFCFKSEIINIVEDDLKLINSCIISLMEVIKEILPDGLYTNLDSNQVVLMVSMEKEHKALYREETERKITKIKEAMHSNIADKFFVYGGNEVEYLTELKTSYDEASYMFHNEKSKTENAVIWYINNVPNIPSYPSQDFSVKLIHYVTTGDKEGLYRALETVIKTYFMDNNLPVYLQHMLLNELQTILFRIIRRIGEDELEYRKYYEKLEENNNATLLSQISNTLNLYRTICNDVYEKKQSKDSSAIMSSIADYIDANYGDRDLSLASVADLYQISEPYLSSVFKQTLGINFSTYMEGVRIDKAKELLKTTELTVNEIANNVGYGSANSFCRAFKRVTGISTSDYRSK